MSLRRSSRINQGVPPVRYGYESQRKAASESHIVRPTTSKPTEMPKEQDDSSRIERTSVGSRAPSKMSRNSTIRRRELEIELQAQRRIVELEKTLIQKEMELKKAELEDLRTECSGDRSSQRQSLFPQEATNNIETVDKRVQNWVDDVQTLTNQFSVLSFRSGKSTYSEHVLGNETGTEDRREREKEEHIRGAKIDPTMDNEEEKAPQEEKSLSKFLARQSISKELPIFSGEPTEWLQFITAFRETTKLCGFSERENIARLQKCLRGKAKLSVQALLNFTCEVGRIIDTLEKRFGKSEFIINDLIASIRKFPQLRDDKLESLLDFSTAVQNLSVTVTSLNCQHYFCNPQLLGELVSKLPPNLKLEWGKIVSNFNVKTEKLNISDFSNWFAEIANAANCVVTQLDSESDKKKRYVCAATEENPRSKFHCLYCKKKNHGTETCRNFQQLVTDKRWEWVKKNKVCFCCMRNNHQIRFCRNKKACGKDGCDKFHHILLHPDIPREDNTATSQNLDSETVSYHAKESEKRILLRVVPIHLKGPTNEIKTYALFDEGSTVTMIDKDLAAYLGATGPIDPLRVQWTNSSINEEKNSQSINLKIRGQNESQEYLLTNVRTVSKLNLPSQTIDYEKFVKKWKYLPPIDIPSMINAEPKLLIGQDNIHLIIAREVIEGGKNSPILSRTKLGWVVHGTMIHRGRVDNDFVLHLHQDEKLYDLVKMSFEIDSLGVKLEEKVSTEESRALKLMEETATRIGNRWEIGLLWKEDDVSLPNSRPAAESRLRTMEKKLSKDPTFAQEYSKKLNEYESNGYARKVIKSDNIKEESSWFLPHFGVLNDKKPGKVRFVFDAAFKVNGISLNDKLLKGPDFLNSLLGVLFKFRQKRIAFTGDIKDMFHRIFIREEDRKFQRFLWWGENGKTEEYEMTVMIFGASSSPASAQFILRKNAKEFEEEFPDAVKVILEQHYMDDYLDSVDTVEEALNLISSVQEVHSRGGFHIRNWTCNSKEVLRQIPTERRTRSLKDIDIEKELPMERVLGLNWDPNADCFLFNVDYSDRIIDILNKQKKTTKREMMKIIMSIFDPLGFLSNYTIKLKILLQEIWKIGIGWDDELEDSINEKWIKWMREFQMIEKFKIPRCYLISYSQENSLQLHTFCDASAKAYSSVSYFRMKSAQEIRTSFVMAKSRVCSLKTVSIPRLELQAAVMGARLAKTIREKHGVQISSHFYWTDSRTVISWLKSDLRKLKPFVSHRVSEILDISNESEWRWISSKINVADDATRDNAACDWSEFNRWIIGPSFLSCDEEKWFDEREINQSSDETDEYYSEFKQQYVALITEDEKLSESIPKLERFSSYLRLLRSTAWILRAINVFKGSRTTTRELSTGELKSAEDLLIKFVQQDSFLEEIQNLKNEKPVEKRSRLYKLSPMLDSNGILRINGRIREADVVSYDTKYPIILDRKHHFTRLLIMHHHNKAGHQGQEFVLNELRQRFWILQARSAVRSAWSSCYRCKIFRAKPKVPEMSPLPKCRVSAFIRPFTFTGLDYFGPMNVTIGRRHEKRYGVLFTCLSVRAVHLEIANSLTTDSTIMAIRRMIARRGCPKKIFADNGTNLKGAEREMKEALSAMNECQISAEMATRGIEWVRIPPLTPHMGGCWERMVRSIKTALAVSLKERSPKEEVLSTLLMEAENIVNSRPLVHVPVDPTDGEALTPNHFLIGTSSASPVPCLLSERDLVSRKQWKVAQYLSDCFWKRWIREYLPTITRRTKWHESNKNLTIGDLVMIIDGDLPRNCWLRGRITAVFTGKDGRVRSADVNTKLGTYRRPVVKLCPLVIQ